MRFLTRKERTDDYVVEAEVFSQKDNLVFVIRKINDKSIVPLYDLSPIHLHPKRKMSDNIQWTGKNILFSVWYYITEGMQWKRQGVEHCRPVPGILLSASAPAWPNGRAHDC